jgi:tetratricopeptide (TPR) repeat protein
MKRACRMSRNRIVVLLGMALLCAHAVCWAQEKTFNYNQAFARANGYYRENKYDAALAQYDSIVAFGLESGNIYFNMGNCYYKKGDLGDAALYYARARVLIPGDRDLEANYSYLKSQLGIESDAQGFAGGRFVRMLDRIFDTASIDTLTVGLACVYLGFCLFLVLSVYFRHLRKVRVPVIGVLVVICALAMVAMKRKIDYRMRCAIVVAQKSEVKFEPLDSATTYFALGRGLAVEVVESSGNWSKIRRSDGKAGWVHTDALKRLAGA